MYWKSVRNITLENWRFHNFVPKSDYWKSVGTITLENFRFHFFVYKSDYWMSVGNVTLKISDFILLYIKVINGNR